MTARADSFLQMEWVAHREARHAAAANRGKAPAVGVATYDGHEVRCTIVVRTGCPRGVVVFDLNGHRVSREHLRRRLDAMQREEITEELQEAREWRHEPVAVQTAMESAPGGTLVRVEAGPW